MPAESRRKIAVLVLTYHLGRTVMACQVLSETTRSRFACATEQARSKAEALSGGATNGPLNLSHLVDDETLRTQALGLAQLYINGHLTRAAEIQQAVVEGALFGVIKGNSGALLGAPGGAERLAA